MFKNLKNWGFSKSNPADQYTEIVRKICDGLYVIYPGDVQEISKCNSGKFVKNIKGFGARAGDRVTFARRSHPVNVTDVHYISSLPPLLWTTDHLATLKSSKGGRKAMTREGENGDLGDNHHDEGGSCDRMRIYSSNQQRTSCLSLTMILTPKAARSPLPQGRHWAGLGTFRFIYAFVCDCKTPVVAPPDWRVIKSVPYAKDRSLKFESQRLIFYHPMDRL